jgi:hypothetical protein
MPPAVPCSSFPSAAPRTPRHAPFAAPRGGPRDRRPGGARALTLEPPARTRARLLALLALAAATVLLVASALARTAGAQQLAPRPAGGAARTTATPVRGHAPALAPDPRLSADEVVGIVLDALARSDAQPESASDADGGLEVLFAFASPANRAVTGSLERFGDLVREEAYRPLLGHRHAVRGALKADGDRARQRVIVTTRTGDRVAYTITLSRQTDGAHKGCWMTDGVTREPPSSLVAPRAA